MFSLQSYYFAKIIRLPRPLIQRPVEGFAPLYIPSETKSLMEDTDDFLTHLQMSYDEHDRAQIEQLNLGQSNNIRVVSPYNGGSHQLSSTGY